MARINGEPTHVLEIKVLENPHLRLTCKVAIVEPIIIGGVTITNVTLNDDDNVK